MLQFALLNLILLSAAVVLMLVVRTIPRIVEEESGDKRGYLERLIASDIPHRIDTFLNVYMGKLFRKLKVALLRWDNVLTEKLKRMAPEEKKIDFRDIAEVAKTEDSENN